MLTALRFAAPLILLASALAGCSGQPAPDEAARVGLPALDLAWGLTSCSFGVVIIDVPASVVQPFVPAGFRVQSVAEVGFEGQVDQDVANPRADGNFGIEVFHCESGEGLNGSVPDLSYGSFFTGVEPPADLRQDVTNHFVKWDAMVPDQARRDLLASYGLPARNGTSSVSVALAQGGLFDYEGSATFDGIGTFAFSGNSVAPLPAGSFLEFTQTPGGLATWSTQYTLVAGGVGPQTVTIPAGTWAATIVGAGSHTGAGFAGIGTFSAGAIHLPAQPVTAQA